MAERRPLVVVSGAVQELPESDVLAGVDPALSANLGSGDPNGFSDASEWSFAYVAGTRTLTLTPVGASASVWSNGQKFTKTSAQAVTHADTEGVHYFYFDDAGTLQTTTTFSTDLILRWAICAIGYWDAAGNVMVPDIQWEMHGTVMASLDHLIRHLTVGSIYNKAQPGMTPAVTLGDGSADAHIQVSATSGSFYDEDIRHDVGTETAGANKIKLYRSGASGAWRMEATHSAIIRTGGTGRALYNQYTGGVWQDTECQNGHFLHVYKYAVNSPTPKYIYVQGQQEFVLIEDAQAAAQTKPDLGALPGYEFILLQTFIVETSDAFANTYNSRIVETHTNDGWYDWREESPQAGSGAAASFPTGGGVNSTLAAILDGAAANMLNNARTKGIMPAPPTVTVETSSVPSGFDRAFIFGAAGHPFVSGGGLPTTVSNNTTFPCVTATSTFQGVCWRVETILDGDEVTFLLDSATADGYRFLVDGQYVSMDGTVSAAGAQRYYTLTFQTRARYRIAVEGHTTMAFAQARVKTADMLFAPPQNNRPRIINIGDSNTMSLGLALKGDGFVPALADHLGILDIWASGVTDTGFVANLSGTLNNYAARRSDWSANSPDLLIFWASINELVQGTTAAAHKAALATELAQARSILGANVPIIVFGIASSNDYLASVSLLATAQAHETALQEAVDEAADDLIRFVPVASDPAGTVLTGTGPGTGNWDYYVMGNNHANGDGYGLVAKWAAQRLVDICADMAGLPVPAFAQEVPPPAIALSTDGWTYIKRATDFTTTGTANADTALAFTPDINSQYEFEALLYVQAAATTTGARPGLSWPTAGITRNAAVARSPSSATADATRLWGGTAAANAAATGVATANQDSYAEIKGLFTTGASVTGALTVTLASEVAGSEVRIMTGSLLRYRKV